MVKPIGNTPHSGVPEYREIQLETICTQDNHVQASSHRLEAVMQDSGVKKSQMAVPRCAHCVPQHQPDRQDMPTGTVVA